MRLFQQTEYLNTMDIFALANLMIAFLLSVAFIAFVTFFYVIKVHKITSQHHLERYSINEKVIKSVRQSFKEGHKNRKDVLKASRRLMAQASQEINAIVIKADQDLSEL